MSVEIRGDRRGNAGAYIENATLCLGCLFKISFSPKPSVFRNVLMQSIYQLIPLVFCDTFKLGFRRPGASLLFCGTQTTLKLIFDPTHRDPPPFVRQVGLPLRGTGLPSEF